jgi:hypothetical protein
LKPTADIDDLKTRLLGGRDNSNLYQAYYRNRELDPGEIIPDDTTSKNPVILRKIVPLSVGNAEPIIKRFLLSFYNIFYIFLKCVF